MPKIKISTILWQSISALLIPSIACIPVYAQQDEVTICLYTNDIVKIIENFLPDIPVESVRPKPTQAIIQIGPFSPSQDTIPLEITNNTSERNPTGSCIGAIAPQEVVFYPTGGQPSMPAVVPQRPVVATQTQPVVVPQRPVVVPQSQPVIIQQTQPVIIPQNRPVIIPQNRPLVVPQRPVVVRPFTPVAQVSGIPATPPVTVRPSISSQRQVHYVVIRVRQEDLLNIFEKLILLKVPERGIFQIQSQPTPILSVGPFATSEIAERWKRYLQDFLF